MTFAEKKKQMEDILAKKSKDAVLKREKASPEDKTAISKFFQAVASKGDARLIQESNDVVIKDYESKNLEWREPDEIKQKAQTVGTGGQGGILVPTTLRQSIIEKMYYISPMRQMSTVINDMPANLVMPVDNALPTTYWVGEGAAITESGATFTSKTLTPNKLAGLDSFTSESLADTAVNPDLQTVVENRFATSLALAENAAFVNGDGTAKPFGFRSSDISPTVVTGNTTAGNLAFTDIIRQWATLPTAYRMMGQWITSTTGLQLIYSLKDSNNRPLYLPGYSGLSESAGDSFLGRPIKLVDEIPNNLGAGTNETQLWFCLPSNYWIGNRGALRVDYGTNGTDFAQDKISLRMIERVAGRPFLDVAWTVMNIK